MIRFKAFRFLPVLLLPAFFATSCSGPGSGGGCQVNCGGGGNANVTVTLLDTPPANTSFVNFNLPIAAISLTPQSGVDVNLTSASTTYEITRLQSDSTLVGTVQVPAGTYTALNVFISNSPFAVWVNSSASAIGTCNPNSICHLSGNAPGKITFTFSPALTLSNAQNVGLGVEINLNNAITSTGGISIDLTQPNIFTVINLPRTGQATGTLDTIESFLGVVQSVTSTQVTLKSDSGATLTAATATGTTFNAPPGGSTACGGTFNFACIAAGQTLSVDATVALDGTLTLTNVDFLDLPASDEIEGVIFPSTTPGTYVLAVSDKVLVSTGALATVLQPVGSGTTLNLTLDTTTTPVFAIETSNLPVFSPVGFSSSSDIFNGQTVLAHVKSASQGTVVNVVSDRLILRFSRLTGTVATVSGSDFTIQNLPSYSPFVSSAQVRTFIPQTTFDGVSDITGLNGVTTPVSIRALLLNPQTAQPQLLAAKVRKH
jgi:hypothetical protein